MELVRRLLVVAVAAVLGQPALCHMTCLTPESELMPRAHVILAARVLQVGKTSVAPCPNGMTRAFDQIYSKCGQVGSLKLKVHELLRGSAPTDLEVLVAPESVLTMTCGDRPELVKMAGLDAVFFLELVDDHLWTLDGPNSIYASMKPYTRSQLRNLKRTFASTTQPSSEKH
jgi:hypothetical protein